MSYTINVSGYTTAHVYIELLYSFLKNANIYRMSSAFN